MAFIEILDLHKKFEQQEILAGINLSINKGETVALLGGSGSGKSVLIKHILGLLSPDSGSVTIDGASISSLDERQQSDLRRKIGMMFQNGALFDSMTVFENVAFPLIEAEIKNTSEIEQRVQEALAIVRLPDQEKKMPSELSGGMRKRVALARAVVGKPECVLYDEPHAGLDPITADKIDQLIKSLQNDHGITNIVITHDIRSVERIADQVVFIKEGRVYWQGSQKEFAETTDQHLKDFRGCP